MAEFLESVLSPATDWFRQADYGGSDMGARRRE